MPRIANSIFRDLQNLRRGFFEVAPVSEESQILQGPKLVSPFPTSENTLAIGRKVRL